MLEFRKRAVSILEKARRLFRPVESNTSTNLPAPTESLFHIDPDQSDDATYFQTFVVQGGYEPEAQDPERDYDTFRRLVSLSESEIPLTDDVFALNDIHLTPWAVSRMGAYLAEITDAADRPRALRAAAIAMRASRDVGPRQLAISNLLCAGNLLLRYSYYDTAADCFKAILTTPLARGSSERVAAHLGMANIHYIARKYHEAAWHYDKCLPHLRLLMKEEGWQGVLGTAYRSYRECNEYGGVLYCMRKINPDSSKRFEKHLKESRPPLDTALLTIARLNLLGDGSVAARLLSAWSLTDGVRT